MKKPTYALLALFAFTVVSLHAADLSDLSWTTTDGEVTITECDLAATGELVIPATIEGVPVTSIGYMAFERCTRLTSITLGNRVTSIEESEDLKSWQATGEKITKTIQLKDGKKFYRFALDK